MSTHLSTRFHRRILTLLLACAASILLRGGTCGGEEKPRQVLTVTFFDVGQGDSILVQCPNGRTILVDGGPRRAGQKVVSCLRDRGVRKIDLLIASHADMDHIGGLPDVIEAFHIDLFVDPGKNHPTQRYSDLLALLAQKNITYEPGRAADVHEFGKVRVEFLHPSNELDENNNNCSVVARVTMGKVSVLLTGDAEGRAEEEMIQRGHELKSQVLKAGHHGSRNSSSYVFLEKVRPEVVVFSCGEENQYGHPDPEAIRVATHFRAQIYRTDESGDIVMETDGEDYSIWTERERKKYDKTIGRGMKPCKIDVNRASVEELTRVPFFSEVKASAVVQYRELVGPFGTVEDLAVIPGIGPSILEKVGHILTTGPKEVELQKAFNTVPATDGSY